MVIELFFIEMKASYDMCIDLYIFIDKCILH